MPVSEQTSQQFQSGDKVRVNLLHFYIGQTFNFAEDVEGTITYYDPRGMYWLSCVVGKMQVHGWAYEEDVKHV